VAEGALAGTTLNELVRDHAPALLGIHAGLDRFPLLFKLLDAQRVLSLQVHPDDRRAAQLSPPDLGKTEAWVVLHAEPGSVIYAGLKRGFDRAAFERELRRGTAELCLHKFEPRVGDCVFIPAGAVHALGAGLVIAEIQQSSDVTYRLFDWNRVGLDGQPRPLHIEQGLEAIDFTLGPISPVQPQSTDQSEVERLVTCDKFVLERWRISDRFSVPNDNRCRILVVVDGAISFAAHPADRAWVRGETGLVPACCAGSELRSPVPTELLSICLP
jgi:mannose-6-phosphate isomerase